jgi:hypothetical protein
MKIDLTKFFGLSQLLQKKGKSDAGGPVGETGREADVSHRRREQIAKLFERMDGRTIQVLLRGLEIGELDDLGPGLDRTQLLETLRPVLRRENVLRTPTLWRRVCQHAEHLFFNRADRYPGAHWHVTRPLVRALESVLEAEMPAWAGFKERYARAATPQDRVNTTVRTASAVSKFLRSPDRVNWEPQLCKASGLSNEQVVSALDVLAGCFAMAGWYLDVQKLVFDRDYEEIDSYYFVPTRNKERVDLSDEQVERLCSLTNVLPEDDKEYWHFLLSQVSVDLKDGAAVLKVFPPVVRREMPERLEKQPYSKAIDMFVAAIERRTRDALAEISEWRKSDIADPGFADVTGNLLNGINAIDRNMHYLFWVVRVRQDSPFSKRVEKARLSLGLAIANVLLPHGVAILESSLGGRSPLEVGPAGESEKLLASLLGTAWRMAETGGQNLAAAGAKDQVFALLSRAANDFRPAMFMPNAPDGPGVVAALTHFVCVAGRLGSLGTVHDLRDRLGPVWGRIPELWPCRDGTRTCCRALVRRPA